jgi:hypothetical protein
LRKLIIALALSALTGPAHGQILGQFPPNAVLAGPPSGSLPAVPVPRLLTPQDLAVGFNASGFALPPFLPGFSPVITMSGPQDFNNQGETIALFDTFGANAQGTLLFSKSGGGSICIGGVAGTVLTITGGCSFGTVAVNQIVIVGGVPTNTTIASLGTGLGGNGTYNLSASGTVAPGSMILTNDSPLHPTGVVNQELLGIIESSGWYGNPGIRTNQSAAIQFLADGGNWTSTSWPTSINFYTAPVGGTSPLLRMSIQPAGGVISFMQGIGAGQADGFAVSNKTAATAGLNQNSPSLHLLGQGWKTNATAGSQPIDWIITDIPLTGAAAPTGVLAFSYQINGAGYVAAGSLSTGGVFNAVTGLTIANAAPTGHVPRGNGTNYVDAQLACADLSTPCITGNQTITLSGDVTGSGTTAITTTVASITSGAAMPGYIDSTQIAAPANPAAGKTRIFTNSTSGSIQALLSTGTFTTTVTPIAAVAHQFLTQLSNGGALSQAQPAITDIAGGVSPQGRLTLQSGTPVMSSSQSGKATIFYDAYQGNAVPYYNGTTDQIDTIAGNEVSTAMVAGAATGGINASDVFDVWWVHGGANRICVATNGGAGASGAGWSGDTGGSTTARGTGYSQVDSTTRPYKTNKNSITHCYNGSTDYGPVSANQGTYLGTFFATAAGQTSVTFGGAGNGGVAAAIDLWNQYNRVKLTTLVQDSNASWTATSSTIGPLDPGGTGSGLNNRVSFVSGFAEDGIDASLQVVLGLANANASFMQIGIALDSTTVFDNRNLVENFSVSPGSGGVFPATARNMYAPQIGSHFIQANQASDGTNANTFFAGTREGLSFAWAY